MSNTPNLRPDGEARAPKPTAPPAFRVVNFFNHVLNVPGIVDDQGQPVPTPEAKAVFAALQALTTRAEAAGFSPLQAARAVDYWLLDVGFSHLMRISGVAAEVFQVGVPTTKPTEQPPVSPANDNGAGQQS